MDYELLFPGRFLKSADFQSKSVTLTITGVDIEDLPQEKGADKARGVVSFSETDKDLVLNRTNASAIAAMFGRDTDGWLHHKVTFHPETVYLGREKVLGIRVVGSPELDGPLEYELKLPRKRPQKVTLHPTGKTPSGAQKAAKPPVGAGAVKTPENGSESQEDDGMDFWPGGDA